ncbi:hypothetical protein L3Q82_009668 [Scortum barcoo]|uniref:Uncharacterized protein n=1 Tax=Scortum barcoo TaxID=214431 RepID=A0ACB8WGY3_9TELE|nr:hypothetical protein L3Q82_009668 [Scortum barcoo]
MATKARVTLENAYWVGDDIYAKVDGKPYLVDSGAEVSMTRRSLETKGHLKVQLANGTLEEMPFGIWKRIVWLKGPYDLITTRDLKELQLPKKLRRSLRRRLDKLQARVVRLEPAQSKATPNELQIIAQANVARFKNDCGDLGGKYVHTIEGGVHPPVRQYPLNPGSCGGDGQDTKQSQGKTAFTHKGKAYVWQRLPQGYKNSPNVFQSAVMDVLKDLGATIYIDDVFIADDTEEEHLEKLQKVIKRLTEAGLKLNLKKCQFGQFEEGASCIHCGVPFKQALHLWDVASALWCDQCYKNHFPIQTARGLACHNDVNYVPVVTMEEILDIEVNAKVMWHSIAAGKDQLMPSAIYQDCVYCTILHQAVGVSRGAKNIDGSPDGRKICGSRTAPANTRHGQGDLPRHHRRPRRALKRMR